MKILIVENDKSIIRSITDIMLSFFTEVSSHYFYGFQNGKNIYKIISVGAMCDLLVVDCGPKTIGGLDLIKKIKSDEKLSHIPIIAMSGYPIDEKKAMIAGANDFILKPFDLDELIKKINKLINP